MALEPEDEISFDLPEEATDELETDNLEALELESDELEADDSKLDFEETSFEIDDLDLETDGSDLDSDGIGLEMEAPEKDAADIEINFDPESYSQGTDVNIEFDEDELTFEDADIEFDDPDEDISPSKELEASDDLDSYEYTSLDQDTPDLEEEELEADLSFDDDPDADLIFEETGPEQDLAQALELEPSDDQHMTFPDLTMEAQGPETSPNEPELSLNLDEDPSDSETRSEENLPEPDDAFSSYDQVLDQDTEPDDNDQDTEGISPYNDTDEEPGETDETLSGRQLLAVQPEQETPLDHPELDPGRPRKRKKKSGMGGPVMLFILLFLLVAGAYIASMTLGYKIPYLSDIKIPILEKYLKKEIPQKTALKPIPNEGSVNGRFISNDTAGELFIITGQIENPSATPYSYLQVKGTLITKGKVKAKTQTIFCGNIISEETLKTGNILDITKQLATREGAHNSNVNIKPGGVVPFMIVFSSLPDNLENFTVEVVEK
jgi:hypothetical protein